MNPGQRGEWHFPQTDATVVLKEDAALDVVKDVKVTWHTAKNGDLYSEFVLCIYPILSAHTQQWTHTHTVGSHLCCGARGAVGGTVPCSRAPQSWYWGWRERWLFTSPTYNSCRQPLGHESDSDSIRPRLPPCHMLCWWGFFMTTSIMLKRSWKLAVMHDLYSWIMKQTVSV